MSGARSRATSAPERRRVGRLEVVLRGPEEAPLVLCLHGFPDLPGSFAPVAERLVAAGYRVAAPFMPGYAPSSLEGPFDLDSVADALAALLAALSPRRPARVVGHDWGAAVTSPLLTRHPERVAAAAALSVPHPLTFLGGLMRSPAQLGRSAYMGFFQLPFLPERVLRANDQAFVEALWRRWSPGLEPPAEHLRDLRACFAESLPAPLAYYRAMFRPPAAFLQRLREARGHRIETPLLYLHGADDGCIGPEIAEGQERWLAGPFESAVLAGCGHFLQLERPDAVAERLVAFFAEHAPPAA